MEPGRRYPLRGQGRQQGPPGPSRLNFRPESFASASPSASSPRRAGRRLRRRAAAGEEVEVILHSGGSGQHFRLLLGHGFSRTAGRPRTEITPWSGSTPPRSRRYLECTPQLAQRPQAARSPRSRASASPAD
ncbi:hypothetical protein ACRAWF_21070 [Streptomyces sp. L7]